MENVVVNRSYLESLSFNELLKLADEKGIDVPEDLNRIFLIGELLEAFMEDEDSLSDDEMIISDDEPVNHKTELTPPSYNSTEVQIMLRNPAWAYVYWNISDSDRISMEKAFISQLMLRVSSFSDKYQIKADEYFDISISQKDNGQYVLLPAGKKFYRVDLLFKLDGIIDILSSSQLFEMPAGSGYLANLKPGRETQQSDIMVLSGINDLLNEHYKNHRESFSE